MPAKKKVAVRKRKNPEETVSRSYRAKLIYGRVLRIEAQKVGPHRCDPGCKKANHCYYHDFGLSSNVHAYGMSDGAVLLIGSKRLWGMF